MAIGDPATNLKASALQPALPTLRSVIEALRQIFTVPADKPDLLAAQCAALSRLVPLMYVILVANTWVLAANYWGKAPLWMTLLCPLVLTIVSALRVVGWWRKRDVPLSTEVAIRSLKRTNYMAAIVAACLAIWALTLFAYGDPLTRTHVPFYLATSAIGCIFCLMHLRSAALIVLAVITPAFLMFFATAGDSTYLAMVISVALITAIMLVVVLLQNSNFTRMIAAQTEAMGLIAENRLKEQEQNQLLRMIDDMPVAVMTVDPSTFKINYVNDTSKRTLGRIEGLLPIKAGELLGTSIDVFHRHPEHQRKLLADPFNLPHRARIKLGPEVLDLQVTAVNAADGSYIGPMLTWSIVTQQVAAESRIRYLAHYDTLTGLANRTTFREALEGRLQRVYEDVGLLFIDLDGFKIVNDTRGHLVGDALLTQVTARLRSVCRNVSGALISRLGGDEFAILLTEVDAERARKIAGELVEALAAPFYLDQDRRVRIGASVGIALAPLHGHDAETLLSRADMALYAAKGAGKGTYRLFSPALEKRIHDRVRLESKLRVALEQRQGLFVYYQPIVDIASGKVTAREALLRWYHPQRGWIPPSEFIPVAEESGLIDALGKYVLDRACFDAAKWADGARVAVNISPGQLGKGMLVPEVMRALLNSGLPVDRLELEVTESALLTNELECIAELRALHEFGVRVALDDFGTGYSSLAHLREFPFDKIKIDGSFVRDAVDRPDCAAVVKVVADLGKRLGVTTVAEGVETQAQLQRVAEEGCREVQGFIFGRPMPSAEDAPIIAALDAAPLESTAA